MTNLFLKVVNMSIAAGWLILAVLLLRLLLKKASKWLSVALWGLVGIRLVVPSFFESVLSLIPSSETISPEIMMDPTPAIDTGVSSLNRVINPVLGSSLSPEPIASANPLQILIPICAVIWVTVMGILLLYAAVRYLLLCRQVAEAVPLRENIFLCEKVSSPFVFHVIWPRIYLPFHLNERDMDAIVAHEKAHVKRRDHWWKILGFFVLSVHWFNPLVWLAYALLCRDMEFACDEKVIREMESSRRADYSQALLNCCANRKKLSVCPLAFGETGVKARVKSVLQYKKPAFLVLLLSVLICAAAACCFLTDPKSRADSAPEGGYAAVGMTPTEADLNGVFDQYLFLDLDGVTYRYEQADIHPIQVRKGKLLERFTEEADPENVDWEIYSVKEYPDYSVLLAFFGSDQKLVYQYSPARRANPDALEQAKKDGCVVLEDGDVTEGQQTWEDFLSSTEAGKNDSVQLAHYYTLDPESCSEEFYEAYQEDYPILYRINLTFDGSSYTLRWMENGREKVKSYHYLVKYSGEAPTPYAVYDSYTEYVLTDDNTITRDELYRSLLSSTFGDAVDFFTVYTDLNMRK